MAISFQCSHCKRSYTTSEQLAGKTVKCKQCGQAVKVPSASAPAPSDVDMYGLAEMDHGERAQPAATNTLPPRGPSARVDQPPPMPKAKKPASKKPKEKSSNSAGIFGGVGRDGRRSSAPGGPHVFPVRPQSSSPGASESTGRGHSISAGPAHIAVKPWGRSKCRHVDNAGIFSGLAAASSDRSPASCSARSSLEPKQGRRPPPARPRRQVVALFAKWAARCQIAPVHTDRRGWLKPDHRDGSR